MRSTLYNVANNISDKLRGRNTRKLQKPTLQIKFIISHILLQTLSIYIHRIKQLTVIIIEQINYYFDILKYRHNKTVL